jgi:hypothetical protein
MLPCVVRHEQVPEYKLEALKSRFPATRFINLDYEVSAREPPATDAPSE